MKRYYAGVDALPTSGFYWWKDDKHWTVVYAGPSYPDSEEMYVTPLLRGNADDQSFRWGDDESVSNGAQGCLVGPIPEPK